MTSAPHTDSSRAPGTAQQVELTVCCGALPGDVCRCEQDAADVARLTWQPIFLGQLDRPSPALERYQ